MRAAPALVFLMLLACEEPARGKLGQPCSSELECDGLSCRAPSGEGAEDVGDLEPQPLVCGEPEEGGAPGEACARGSDCALSVCLLAGACARPCDDDAACEEGERCQAVFARHAAEALTTLKACVARVDLADGASISRELRRAAVEDGESELELPAVDADETTFFVLEHQQPSWPDTRDCRPPLCVRELSAAGEVLFRADVCEPEALPLAPIATGEHIDPVVIRLAGQAAELGQDGYRLRVASEAAGDVSITRIASAGQGERLDLNLFYVGARDLEAEGERGPPLVADALDVVDGIFAQAGIFIGEVRQVDVPGGLPERGVAFLPDGDRAQGFATIAVRFGVYVELPELFRLSAGAGNAAVNVFFVGEIEPLAGGGEPEAQAGGIPGPLGMHGTGGSGIAISADMMEGDPQTLGRTLAHELGHFLGLFHTSEADGCVRDALSDTPACTLLQDTDRDGRLDTADCAEHGADNLMFWAKTSGTELTPQQIEVLRSAPVLN